MWKELHIICLRSYTFVTLRFRLRSLGPGNNIPKVARFQFDFIPRFFLFNTNPQLLQLRLAFSTVQFPDLHSSWSIIMIKVKALKIRTVWDNWAWSNDPPFKGEFHNKNSLNPWQNKVTSLALHGTNCGESIGLGGVRTYPFLCLHQPVFYQSIGLGAFYVFQGMVSWPCQSEKQKSSAKNCLKWR